MPCVRAILSAGLLSALALLGAMSGAVAAERAVTASAASAPLSEAALYKLYRDGSVYAGATDDTRLAKADLVVQRVEAVAGFSLRFRV